MPSTKHNNVWASTEPTTAAEDLELPSGQTCSAKKIGIEGLLDMGILAEADSLTAMVQQHTRQVKGGNGTADGVTIDEASLIGDKDAIKAIIGLADKAMPVIVLDPPVHLHYSTRKVGKTSVTKMLTPEDREKIREETGQPELVFTDQIGFEDKMFLFDWAVGGLKSFTSFRPGPQANVGSVADVARPAKSTKRTPRVRR
jgi:hypothetical protein